MPHNVKERINAQVARGEANVATAREILAIGDRAGIDLARQAAELTTLEARLAELKEAVEASG